MNAERSPGRARSTIDACSGSRLARNSARSSSSRRASSRSLTGVSSSGAPVRAPAGSGPRARTGRTGAAAGARRRAGGDRHDEPARARTLSSHAARQCSPSADVYRNGCAAVAPTTVLARIGGRRDEARHDTGGPRRGGHRRGEPRLPPQSGRGRGHRHRPQIRGRHARDPSSATPETGCCS